jgi:hypothetical protein
VAAKGNFCVVHNAETLDQSSVLGTCVGFRKFGHYNAATVSYKVRIQSA